ncbi:MAG: hypothetical protein MK165_04105 [Pirellulaceae bacterium]|nr:hypothetical protein [Pirellulaceae bacterium]
MGHSFAQHSAELANKDEKTSCLHRYALGVPIRNMFRNSLRNGCFQRELGKQETRNAAWTVRENFATSLVKSATNSAINA